MSDEEERVARAIWDHREKSFPERVRRSPDALDRETGVWRATVELARAAIAAMRETPIPAEVPRAESTSWYMCEACEHLHLVLRDLNEKPIADGVLSREMLERMLACLDEGPQLDAATLAAFSPGRLQ